MRRKKPFLLMELLIAFTLVTLFSFLLVRTPLLFFQKDIEALEWMELERHAELAFAEIKAELYSNKIDLETLPKTPKHAISRSYPEIQIPIKNLSSHSFSKKITLWTGAEKKTQAQEILHRIVIKISFKRTGKKKHSPRNFIYHLFVKSSSAVTPP